MIIPAERESWLSLVVTYHGSALSRIKQRLVAVFCVALVVTFVHEYVHVMQNTITIVPFTLVGVALGIFLGFRNNTSYDRWWEGRRLWGALVNVTRTFARDAQVYIAPAAEEANVPIPAVSREVTLRTIAYVHALRMLLRRSFDWEALGQRLSADEIARLRARRNPPVAILLGTGQRLRDAFRAGQIDLFHLPTLQDSLARMTDIQGGCERIKNTPIPQSYSILMHRIVAIYCFALPFGLVDSLHEWTPAVVLIVAYAFLGLDAVGDEIADPFGEDPNDLPLTGLSNTIEIDLLQTLGETEVPEVLAPVRGVLS